MAVYYFDSSAIVKRYVSEVGAKWVIATTDSAAGHDILVSLLARVEVPAAILKRRRERSIKPEDAASAVSDFIEDFDNQYQPIQVTRHVVEKAVALADKHGLRAYDAVQLAAALDAESVRHSLGLAQLIFVSSDEHLNAAARREGLQVDNPNNHP